MKADEKRARVLVAARASGVSGGPLCEGCLEGRAGDWAHRLHRSRGGLWCPSNGLALCRTCHTWQHAESILAEERGWTVPSEKDPDTGEQRAPASFKVWLARWGDVYLLPDGSMELAAGRAA